MNLYGPVTQQAALAVGRMWDQGDYSLSIVFCMYKWVSNSAKTGVYLEFLLMDFSKIVF